MVAAILITSYDPLNSPSPPIPFLPHSLLPSPSSSTHTQTCIHAKTHLSIPPFSLPNPYLLHPSHPSLSGPVPFLPPPSHQVIFDPYRTGFEDSKTFTPPKGTIIAGRYEVTDVLGQVRSYSLFLSPFFFSSISLLLSLSLPLRLPLLFFSHFFPSVSISLILYSF